MVQIPVTEWYELRREKRKLREQAGRLRNCAKDCNIAQGDSDMLENGGKWRFYTAESVDNPVEIEDKYAQWVWIKRTKPVCIEMADIQADECVPYIPFPAAGCKARMLRA